MPQKAQILSYTWELELQGYKLEVHLSSEFRYVYEIMYFHLPHI